MRILVVDDHDLFREGLVALLEKEPDITIVNAIKNDQEVLEKVRLLEPDLVIMDLDWQDQASLETIKEIQLLRKEINVIILTHHESDEYLFAAIRHGAMGYLLKDISTSKLLSSIRAIERGEADVSRTMTKRILEEFTRLTFLDSLSKSISTYGLTKREKEIIELITKGATNDQIARTLSISYSTVKIHVHHILRKLRVRNRSEIVNIFRR